MYLDIQFGTTIKGSEKIDLANLQGKFERMMENMEKLVNLIYGTQWKIFLKVIISPRVLMKIKILSRLNNPPLTNIVGFNSNDGSNQGCFPMGT